MRRSYKDEDFVDELWRKYIGSHFLSEKEEVMTLIDLQTQKIVAPRMMYKLYLESKYWKRRRNWAIKRDRYRCTQCKSTNRLSVDHIRYKPIGQDLLEDLRTLCSDCHARKTTAFQFEGNDLRKAKKVKVKNEEPLYSVLRR